MNIEFIHEKYANEVWINLNELCDFEGKAFSLSIKYFFFFESIIWYGTEIWNKSSQIKSSILTELLCYFYYIEKTD